MWCKISLSTTVNVTPKRHVPRVDRGRDLDQRVGLDSLSGGTFCSEVGFKVENFH